MSLREQLDTVALALAVLAVAMAGSVALSGNIAAQSGTPQPDSGEVELQDPIPEDSTEFDVEVTELNLDGEQGCLDVEKNDEFQTRFDVTEGETVTVSADDVGGLQEGDEIFVELLRSTCEGPLDTDRTTVNEAGFFIDINSTNSPVTEGETYEVEARIENTGAQAGTEDVVMTVAGVERDRETVGLDSRASITETFTWETEPGDAGDYDVALSSENDEAVTDARVERPAEFAVTIEETNSPVPGGDPLEVTATVENTDDFEDSQEVVLNVDGNQTGSTNLTLDGGESQTVQLDWATDASDVGDHTAEVASETDADERDVRVEEPAEFVVTIDGTNSPVVEGETLEVTATVQNDGDESDGQEVSLAIDGERIDSIDVALDGGESETVRLDWATGDGDAGDYTAEVATGNDSDSAAVTVTTATPTPTSNGENGDSGDGDATFEVNITEVRSPDEAGGSLEVDATVENTGEESDTQTVSLDVDGEETDSQELTLDSGESRSVTFTSSSAPEDTERQSVRVASEDDADEDAVRLDEATETDSDDGLLPGNSGGILLLLLLLLLLLAYYYVRRRQYQSDRVPVGGDGGGDGAGGDDGADGAGGDGE